jgi:RNA polymerase sigma factor (sigma-70 family)
VKYPSAPPLPSQEEHCLIKQAQEGVRSAKDTLVRANIRLVYKLSWPFQKRYGGEIDDYVQEGLLGFLSAIERFDTSKGMRLGVYAAHWVKAYVRNYVFRNTSAVKFWTTNALDEHQN